MSIAVELNIFSCRTPLYVGILCRRDALPSVLLFACAAWPFEVQRFLSVLGRGAAISFFF